MSLKSIFSDFSKHLAKASKDAAAKGATEALTIFTFLRKKRNDVSRYVIAGCLGANLEINGNNSPPTDITATTPPDFDLVIFLKNQNPPFQQVLIEFADAFSKNLDVKIVNTSHSQYIGIVINGLKFHVFPAVDLTSNDGSSDEDQLTVTQRNRTFQTIISSQNLVPAGRMYSSSLAESAVKFMADQSDFTHAVINLAKLWLKQVHLDEDQHLHGSSYLMECLAVHVSSKTTKNDLMDAFTHFLALVTNLSKLRVVFPSSQIPDCFKHYKGPLVLDPVNPYNNLAIFRSESALQEEIVSCLQTAGMNTLWKWEAAKSKNIRVSSMEDISTLFRQKRTQGTIRQQTRRRFQGVPRNMSWLMWFLVIVLTPFVLIRSLCRVLGRRMDLTGALAVVLFASYIYFYH
ncbi:unnamed protein product [Allacma fusca]|uniref:2'-5'-oligoadenylate synthetase 1 domain-containing protein n=1 Tax=Allacma fusca TaxID=39272 RepID=A0A8J2P9V9_9HEXA|nr:unnamed protein product [Allacma fusca]